jgi:hypothetical protein
MMHDAVTAVTCGLGHRRRKSCPAYGKTYELCNKRNHFASVCQTNRSQASINVNQIEVTDRHRNKNNKIV